MKTVVITFPGNEALSVSISDGLNAEKGEILIRHFPDGESYVRLMTDVLEKRVIVVATLHRPDDKLLPLLFLLRLLKDAGAEKIILVSPYLAYMRQDKQFKPGEAVTSSYFGQLISPFIDELITIDPHLHRRHDMAEIYSAPCKVLHAAEMISAWIKHTLNNPVLIGPDSESEQWVSSVAIQANAPYIILQKHRHGESYVEVHSSDIQRYRNHMPVLVDDIISTAHTMIETTKLLKEAGFQPPVCIGVHAVFSKQSYAELQHAGVARIITSNTIPHESNEIDVSPLIIESLRHG